MHTIKYEGSLTGIFKTKEEAHHFVEDKSLANAEVLKINSEPKLNSDLNRLTSSIKSWSIERNLHTQEHRVQTLKIGEEVGELFKAVVKDNQAEVIDAVGDTYVTLVILCQQLGIELADCVSAAYNEIKDRRGEIVNGTYVKEE